MMNIKEFFNEYEPLLDELFNEVINNGRESIFGNGHGKLYDIGHVKPKTENSFIHDIDLFYTIDVTAKENVSTFYYVPVGDHFMEDGKINLCFLEVTTNKLDKEKYKSVALSALYDAYCEYEENLNKNE